MKKSVKKQTQLSFQLGGVVQQPGTGIGGYVAPTVPTTGFTPLGTAVAPVTPGSLQPQQATTPVVNYGQGNLPTFGSVVGTGGGAYNEIIPYVNAAGQIQQIPHVNGKPIYPVPEGYTKQVSPTDVTPDSPLVDTTKQVRDDGGGDSDNDGSFSTGAGTAKVGSISDVLGGLFGSKDDKPTVRGYGQIGVSGVSNIYDQAAKTNNYFGGNKDFGWSNEELRSATAGQGFAQFGSAGLGGMLSSLMKEAEVTDFNLNDVGVAGFTAMNDSLNSMGLTNRGQLMNNAQATLVGKAMAAAHSATYKGQDVEAAYNKVMNTPEARATIDKTVESIRDYYSTDEDGSLSLVQAAEVARADARTFRKEVNDLANPTNGSARITNGEDGPPINTIIDPTTGQRIQDPTKSRAFTKEGGRRVRAAEAKQKQAETNAKALRDKVERDAIAAGKDKFAAAEEAGYRSAPKSYEPDTSDDNNADGGFPGDDTGRDDSANDTSSNESGSGGGMGGGFGSQDDGFGGGDYKGAFVGKSYKKNKLAKQMKRSGLASKK